MAEKKVHFQALLVNQMSSSMTQKLRHLFGQQPVTLLNSFVFPKQSAHTHWQRQHFILKLSRMTTVLYSRGKEGRRSSASTYDCLLANGLHVRCERNAQSGDNQKQTNQVAELFFFSAEHYAPPTQTKLFSMPHSFTKCFIKPSSSV